MNFSFDEGSDNLHLRSIIYDGAFEKKLEAFATAYRKAEKKLLDEQQKEVDAIHLKTAKAIEELKAAFKKKLKLIVE